MKEVTSRYRPNSVMPNVHSGQENPAGWNLPLNLIAKLNDFKDQ
jgi:hypothetical protein